MEKDLNIKLGVKKFDGNRSDFKIWKIRVVAALKADKSWVACGNNFDLAEIGKEAENEALDDKAKMIIMSTVTDSVLRNVFKETAKEMWQVLCAKYEAKDVQGLNFTRRKFLNCKQENESVESYIDRVASLRDELEANEIEVDDLESIMTIMQGISSEYEIFVQLQ